MKQHGDQRKAEEACDELETEIRAIVQRAVYAAVDNALRFNRGSEFYG